MKPLHRRAKTIHMEPLKHSLAIINKALGANACLSPDNRIIIDSYYLNTKDRFQSERVTVTLRKEMQRMDRKLSRDKLAPATGSVYHLRDLKFRRRVKDFGSGRVRSKAFPMTRPPPAETAGMRFGELVDYRMTHRRTVSDQETHTPAPMAHAMTARHLETRRPSLGRITPQHRKLST